MQWEIVIVLGRLWKVPAPVFVSPPHMLWAPKEVRYELRTTLLCLSAVHRSLLRWDTVEIIGEENINIHFISSPHM